LCAIALLSHLAAGAWGFSSAGRAVALQASGHRFDPDKLHHAPEYPRDEDTRSPCVNAGLWVADATLFDIVNGFLKSMPRGVGFEQGAQLQGCGSSAKLYILVYTMAEIIIPHRAEPLGGTLHACCRWFSIHRRCSAELMTCKGCPALMLVVWALKREVRAIRGCLGAYRR
jgi:hypothetical protein